MTFIRTYTGRKFFFDRESILTFDYTIQDIARALTFLNRFNGHTSRPYSVAEHSLWVARLVPEQDKLAALLHDATEAFIGDMVKPLKSLEGLSFFSELEDLLQERIFKSFGLSSPKIPKAVHLADNLMCGIELRDLLEATPVDVPWLKHLPSLYEELRELGGCRIAFEELYVSRDYQVLFELEEDFKEAFVRYSRNRNA